jgi:hypothetical protein
MRAFSRWAIVLAFFAAPILCSTPLLGQQRPDYDLLIRGGKVVDGTGNPWFYADIGVRDGKIVSMERKLPGKAKREINAKGLVVAPGSSTSIPIPTGSSSKTATAKARFARASPPKSLAKAPPPAPTKVP